NKKYHQHAHHIPILYYNTTIFFFQAEDVIRDRNVTGVQTCALPISSSYHTGGGRQWSSHWRRLLCALANRRRKCAVQNETRRLRTTIFTRLGRRSGKSHDGSAFEIGRASCSERV